MSIPLSEAGARSAYLVGLDSAAFAHPLDRSAMLALRRLRVAELGAAKLMEWSHERKAHVLHNATSIRVTRDQLPDIHRLMIEACRILDLQPPELYISSDPGRNAYTSGHNNPYIVLHSELVDATTNAELQAVIAHELGHIKCNHVLYKEMATWVEGGLRGVGSLGRGNGYTMAAGLAMRYFANALKVWNQKSELSADRAAMLVVRDEDVCIRMILKLAGAPARFAAQLDVAQYLQQAAHLHGLLMENSAADNFRRRLSAASSHPLSVERAVLLHQWVEAGGPAQALAAPRVQIPASDEPAAPRVRRSIRRSRAKAS
jgi:Zn-dependent protease with chaperone function